MGGFFSSGNSSSNLGSVPKELKDYIIKNPNINKISKMPCSQFLKFTDGDKNPDLTYYGRVINEINSSNNNSKNKYIGVCGLPDRKPTNIEIEEYKNNLFIYYEIINREVKFKILTQFKECISESYETAYKFKNDNENYHPNDIYTLEKPKNNNNNKKGGFKKNIKIGKNNKLQKRIKKNKKK